MDIKRLISRRALPLNSLVLPEEVEEVQNLLLTQNIKIILIKNAIILLRIKLRI
nr:MAG TPA: hypothetical protein [Caudoviricetes sp.]